MKFTVDRSTWVAGRPKTFDSEKSTDSPVWCGKGFTCLLNGKGFRCCLGHVCKQLGIADTRLSSTASPYILRVKKPLFSEYFLSRAMTEEAVIINDDEFTTLEEKEYRLRQLFLDNDHEIEFIGEYVR